MSCAKAKASKGIDDINLWHKKELNIEGDPDSASPNDMFSKSGRNSSGAKLGSKTAELENDDLITMKDFMAGFFPWQNKDKGKII